MWEIALYGNKLCGKFYTFGNGQAEYRFQATNFDSIGLPSRKVDWNGSCLLIYYYRQICILLRIHYHRKLAISSENDLL